MKKTVRAIMPSICEGGRANGIDPSVVPVWAVPTIAAGSIRCPVYLRNAAGNLYLQPGSGEPARDYAEVPLLVEPPQTLNDWLAGKVPAP